MESAGENSPAARTSAGGAHRRSHRQVAYPVVPIRQAAAPVDSRLRVKQLPMPHRRRREISPDAPHHNETPAVVFTQAALIILGVVLFVGVMIYFFSRVSPFANPPPSKPPPPSQHNAVQIRAPQGSAAVRSDGISQL